jgi:hypothetical protein
LTIFSSSFSVAWSSASEARLLLSLVAANLLHAGAELLARDEAGRVSRERFRQLLLKVTGRRCWAATASAS